MDCKAIALKDFGYQFLGPMCSHYFQSLCELIKQHNGESSGPIKLVFLAREGYFFKQAYDALVQRNLAPSADSVYLRVSRTFLFRICIGDPKTWDISLDHKYTGKLEALLTHRFGFSANQAHRIFEPEALEKEIELPAQIDEVKTLFAERLSVLNELTAASRSDYITYLRESGMYDQNTLLMLDVGYSGTIQKLLTMLLAKDTTGLYFMTTQAGDYTFANATASMSCVFKDQVKMGEGYMMLDRSLFMESLLTSPNGQFLDIYTRHPALQQTQADKFEFVYGRESYVQTHFFELHALHEGIQDAVLHHFENGISFSIEEIEFLYEQYTSHRHMMPSSAYALFDVDDAISGNGNVNPMQLFRL
ncbi:HAD family hydrolase [Glaciecola siphonariae]|uniref:HAD family hydrolase n=1 Tax=Glaciecola siphonariae TaxID=521012 RepID=A0ABV9LW18_9ALTE